MSSTVIRIVFSILSVAYIAAIFLLAGSPVAHTLSEFNPYSLLHIPLYGIMTLLLVFSLVPIPRGFRGFNHGSIQTGIDSTSPRSSGAVGLKLRLLVAGATAWVVGILDEIHQLAVPNRDASVGDVILDMAGIAIALLLCLILFKTRSSKQTE